MLTGSGQRSPPCRAVSNPRSSAKVKPLMTANPSRLGGTIPARPNGSLRTMAAMAAVNRSPRAALSRACTGPARGMGASLTLPGDRDRRAYSAPAGSGPARRAGWHPGGRPCQAGVMNADVLFVGVAVSDFRAAQAWYERFFARPADVVAHEEEVMWQVTERGWLYIVRDADHAGHGIVTMAVPDIEGAASALRARGVPAGPIEPEGDAGRKAVVLDPDGNSIAIIEVTGGG